MFVKMQRKSYIVIAAFLLSACYSNSDIQARYARHEGQCHSEARDALERASEEATDRASSSAIAGKAFSECMTEKGWKVATQKPISTAQHVTPPIGPSTSGGVPGGTASGAAARAAPGSSPVMTSPVVSPPVPAPTGALPSAAPPVLPAAPTVNMPRLSVDPNWSTYQPAARPEGSLTPEYGRGAGRNF